MIKKYYHFLNESADEESISINLNPDFEKRLKTFKIDQDRTINIGDLIYVKNTNKGKLPDNVYNYIMSQDTFKVLNINENGKLDIGYVEYYRREDGVKVKKGFYFSKNRFEKLDLLDPVAQFFISLKKINKNYIQQNNPIDYLDMDKDGNISFISTRFIEQVSIPLSPNEDKVLD